MLQNGLNEQKSRTDKTLYQTSKGNTFTFENIYRTDFSGNMYGQTVQIPEAIKRFYFYLKTNSFAAEIQYQ